MTVLSRYWNEYRSIYCVYQGVPINNCTHVPGSVSQSSSESDYNAACTSLMNVAHFRIINNELLIKYPDVVPEQAHLIILDRKF